MSKQQGTKEFWLAGLRAEGAAFRAAVGVPGALEAAVPSCPQWRGLDLVHHLGGVYERVRDYATGRASGRPTPPTAEELAATTALPGADAVLGWWDERFAHLLTTLDDVDPEQQAWNWAPQPKKAVFWHRRMAHETAVHRWDAQFAVGAAEPVEAKLAADGVGEVLDTWLPAGRRLGRLDRHGIVALHATDIAQQWHVRLRGEGLSLLDIGTLLDHETHGQERAAARGTASDLLLALYGRIGFDTLDVTGDAALLTALRTG